MMQECYSFVNSPSGKTDSWRVWGGVLQGDTLAPFLFILVIDVILRHISHKMKGFKILSTLGELRTITDLNYADDLEFFFEEDDAEEQATEFIAILDIESAQYGLKINYAPGKSEVTTTNIDSPKDITSPNGLILKRVDDYKYLGAYLNLETEYKRRTSLAWAQLQKFKPIWRSSLSMQHKAKLFSSLVLVLFTDGMNTWPINKTLLSKIKVDYHRMIKFVKNIKVFSFESRISTTNLLGTEFKYIEDLLLFNRLKFVGICQRSKQPIADILLAPILSKSGKTITKKGGVPQLPPYVQHLINDIQELVYKGNTPSLTDLQSAMINTTVWKAICETALKTQQSNRTDTTIAAQKSKEQITRMVKRQKNFPPLKYNDLSMGGKLSRNRDMLRHYASTICKHRSCNKHYCTTHCQVCSDPKHVLTDENRQREKHFICDLCLRVFFLKCLNKRHTMNNLANQVKYLPIQTYICRECSVISECFTMSINQRHQCLKVDRCCFSSNPN